MSRPLKLLVETDTQSVAAQRPANTPLQPTSQQPYAQPPPSLSQGYPGVQPTATPPVALSGYALPQPTSSGSLDLSAIKPTNSGSVSIAEAIAKARGIAAEKGVSYDGRSSAGKGLYSAHTPGSLGTNCKQIQLPLVKTPD